MRFSATFALLVAALAVLTGCGSSYALSPEIDSPRAAWREGALAARAAGSTQLLPSSCPEEWLFVRELRARRGWGQYEVYGCARTAVLTCTGDTPTCRVER
jgi:hypothetical protein